MSLALQEKCLRQILADFELADIPDEGICNGNGLCLIFSSQSKLALGQFQPIVPNGIREAAGINNGGGQIELPSCNFAQSVNYRPWGPNHGRGHVLSSEHGWHDTNPALFERLRSGCMPKPG